MRDTPSSTILSEDLSGKPRSQLNYSASTSRPDMILSVHQAARFFSNPKRSHEEAVRRIVRHLRTKDKGILHSFDATKPIEVFVDAYFSGAWQSA